MKNTKELRKQFADAIMDGRFDEILEFCPERIEFYVYSF